MPTVLFICVGNSCRSQMAEGLMRHHSKGEVEALSAGTRPASQVSGKATEVMRERGIDISTQRPKAIDMELVAEVDRLISMGCGVEGSCPVDLYDKMEDWGLEDPYGQGIEKYREVRDKIEAKVKGLLCEIDASNL